MVSSFDDLSMILSANAQENKPEVMPFNFNSPREPQLAPDAGGFSYMIIKINVGVYSWSLIR